MVLAKRGPKTVRRSDKTLKIIVQDTASVKQTRPVTGGVPLPEGAAPRGTAFVLKNAKGSRVPLQSKVLARWNDGSARWMLLDFAADPRANGKSEFHLAWRGSAKPMQPATPLRVRRGRRPAITSDLVKIERSDEGVFRLNNAFDVALRMTDSRGRIHVGVASRAKIETAGRLRSALLLEGDLKGSSGRRAFSFRMRVTAFAGISRIRVEPMIIVDPEEGVFQPVRELRLEVRPLAAGSASGAIGGNPGWAGPLAKRISPRLFQTDDQQYRIEGARARGGRAPGWAEFSTHGARLAVCLRSFWQQWPKSIELAQDCVGLGLLPRFTRGAFDHMKPWLKYGYLFKGACYQLKTGQTRRWDIWMDLSGPGERLCKLANAPSVPVPDPEQALTTSAWGPILPAGRAGSQAYDAWADAMCNAFAEAIEANRDYGAMNWGDWHGERNINWGNNEYDTGNQLLIAFARTGNPSYFYMADAFVRHMSEVDIIHFVNPDLAKSFRHSPGFPVRPGCVHEHCLGHVGGFCTEAQAARIMLASQPPGPHRRAHTGYEPRNLGHLWADGMVRHYFLTGDTWLRESAEMVADSLARLVEDRGYPFIKQSHGGRTTGWPLQVLAAVYEIAHNRRYLRAMKSLVNGALAEQDPNCGGWLYKLTPGHCWCVKEKHVGAAGFLTAILVNGLTRYCETTGDPRIPAAVHRAMEHLNRDTWRDEVAAWRYTSCPASPIGGQPGVTMLALANSIRLKPDEEQKRIFRKAFQAKLKRLPSPDEAPARFGKSFTAGILGSAEAAALMEGLKRASEELPERAVRR